MVSFANKTTDKQTIIELQHSSELRTRILPEYLVKVYIIELYQIGITESLVFSLLHKRVTNIHITNLDLKTFKGNLSLVESNITTLRNILNTLLHSFNLVRFLGQTNEETTTTYSFLFILFKTYQHQQGCSHKWDPRWYQSYHECTEVQTEEPSPSSAANKQSYIHQSIHHSTHSSHTFSTSLSRMAFLQTWVLLCNPLTAFKMLVSRAYQWRITSYWFILFLHDILEAKNERDAVCQCRWRPSGHSSPWRASQRQEWFHCEHRQGRYRERRNIWSQEEGHRPTLHQYSSMTHTWSCQPPPVVRSCSKMRTLWKMVSASYS